MCFPYVFPYLTSLYEGRNANIEQELVADLVGDYLFTDTDFVNRLSTEHRNIFEKIFDEIKYLCRIATAGSKEARQLEKVKKAFEEACRAETKNPTTEGGVKYSLMAFEKDGRRFVNIDQDRFDGHSVDEYPGIANEIIKEKFENKVIGIDNKMFVNGAGRSEFAYPSKPITDVGLYEAKMRSSPELDNLLDAGTNFRNEADGQDGHIHPDAIGGFDYFDTLFRIGNRYFEGRINIKNIKRGKLFTDVTQIKDVTQAIMSSYGQNPKSQFLRTSSMDIIRNPGADVNTKNSLSNQQADDLFPLPGNTYGKDINLEFPLPPGYAERANATTAQSKDTTLEFPLPPGYKEQSDVIADETQVPAAANISVENTTDEEVTITTVKERLEVKQKALQTELTENQRLREQSAADLDAKIAKLQAE